MAGSGKVVPSIEFVDLKENMPNFDAMVNSTDLTFTNRESPNGNVTSRTIAGFNADGDAAIANISNTSAGLYINDPLITSKNQYVNYDRSGVGDVDANETYRLRDTTTVPYQIDSIAIPDPLNDPNLQPFDRNSAESIILSSGNNVQDFIDGLYTLDLFGLDEPGIIAARSAYESNGIKTFVPDINIVFNQPFQYPINHLVGIGKLTWNGNQFDIGLASGYKEVFDLGYRIAKMNAGATTRIGCIGDSTTDGTNTTSFVDNPSTTDADGKKLPSSNTNHSDVGGVNAWPTKMRTMARDYHSNTNIQAFNGGYGGQAITIYTPGAESYKTSWPYKYFERIFFDNPSYGNLEICIISFGLNSSVSTDVFRIDDVMAGLDMLVYKIRGYGATPVILTTDAVLLNTMQAKSQEEFNTAYKTYGDKNNIPVLDCWTAETKFWTQNNLYKWQPSQTDRVHQNDQGHQFKAGFIGKELMGATVSLTDSRQSVILNQREAHNTFGAIAPMGSAGDLRFGGITIFEETNRIQTATWVWCESAQYDFVMRDFGIDYTTSPTLQSELPSVNVKNSVGYDDGAYVNKTNSIGGRSSFYQFPAEMPNIIGKLQYGLNKIENIGPSGALVTGAYVGYLQFNLDPRLSDSALYSNQVGSQKERVALPSKSWRYNPTEDGVSKIYIAEAEDWSKRNIVSYANAGDIVDLFIECNITQDVGMPICDGQTDTGRGGLILYQTTSDIRLFEHRKLDNGTISFDDLGVVLSAKNAATDIKLRVRMIASADGLDQTLNFYTDWDTATFETSTQRSVVRTNTGAFRCSGAIGGMWSGNGEPVVTAHVDLLQCIIVKS